MLELKAPQRRGLVAHVENELRQALLEGRLEPGTRLITRELAEQLHTSLTPVREALVKLVAAGALTSEHSQSFQVPRLTSSEYEELAEIRKAVEGLAAVRAAEHATGEAIVELEKLLSNYLTARAGSEPHAALKHNKHFRFAVYHQARMPQLLDVIEGLWLKTGPGFNYLFAQDRVAAGEHHNYDDLISALRRRDGPAARAVIERAIDDGTAIILKAMKTHDRLVSPAIRRSAGMRQRR
jgi:GntR family transcriptional regulator, colanic acid and biofilm gene transcriptional regulator